MTVVERLQATGIRRVGSMGRDFCYRSAKLVVASRGAERLMEAAVRRENGKGRRAASARR